MARRAGSSLAILGGVVVLVVVALVALAVVGLGARSGDVGPSAAPPPTGAAPAPERDDEAVAPVRPGPTQLGPVVRMAARNIGPETFPQPVDAVDRLAPSTVLQVRVTGFEPFTAARARQCVTTERRTCGNAIAVQFDEGGRASFQYLVVDDFPGRCGAQAAPCSLEVAAVDGDHRAEIRTVFGDRLPAPARVRVTPRTGLADGQVVVVEVEHYPPGTRAEAMLCAPPAAVGTERCGRPGPAAPIAVRADGTGRGTLTIRAGPVGTDRVRCTPLSTCGVSVVSAAGFPLAPVVPIRFATPPGADYDLTRLGAGLLAAVMLLGLVVWLVRRTDWGPIGEEQAPEIDTAEYADLDAIVAALPPDEDLEEALLSER